VYSLATHEYIHSCVLQTTFLPIDWCGGGTAVGYPNLAPQPETATGGSMIKVPNKIGFHTGPGGNPTGIGDYMRALDAAKIPMVLKSVDHYGPIFEAQEIMKKRRRFACAPSAHLPPQRPARARRQLQVRHAALQRPQLRQ
jgi:hypothetical protein